MYLLPQCRPTSPGGELSDSWPLHRSLEGVVVRPSVPLPSCYPWGAAPLPCSVWVELAPQLQEESLTQSLLTEASHVAHSDWLRDEYIPKSIQ